MRSIIKSDSVSIAQIRTDLESFKSSLPYYEELKRNTPAATLTLIDDLMSEFGAYMNFKWQMERKETYLSTAVRESSILSIASMLGYNTNRPTCPIITFQYNSIPTKSLKHGDEIGKLEDGTPIIYFGNSMFIEKGDLINMCVGNFNSIEPQTLSSFSTENYNYKHILVPTLAKAIDNNNIKIYVSNKEINQTRDPETYVVGPLPKTNIIRVADEPNMLSIPLAKVGMIVYREDINKYYTLQTKNYTDITAWVEFLDSGSINVSKYAGAVLNHSIDSTSAILYLTNREYYQGANIGMSDSIEITWIETNGYKYLTQNTKVAMNDGFDGLSLISIQSMGTNGDSLDKIKQLAPLYYTSLRRAVTSLDYKFIFESNEYMASVEIEKDMGVAEQGIISIPDTLVSGDTISVKLGEVYTITYTITDSDTFIKVSPEIITVQEKLSYLIGITGLAVVSVVDNNINITINSDARIEYVEITNGTYSVIVNGVKPACCTVNVYYIKHNTTDIPILLSDYEQQQIANFMAQYKMVGITMRLIPAVKREYEVKIQVKLTNPSVQTATYEAIRNLLDQYELILGTGFSYGEFLARASQIKIDPDGNGSEITPIVYILPDQVPFNVSGEKDSYLKFVFTEGNINVVP